MGNSALYAILLSAIIAGSNGLLIKSMSSMTAGSIAGLRATIPIIIMAGWMLNRHIKFFRGNYKKMLIASFVNAARLYLYLTAFIYTSIGNAAILSYTWPIFVSILSLVFLKEKMTRYQLLLLLMAFVGLIIAYSHKSFSFEDRDFIGMLAAITAAFGYAITVIIFKSESHNYDKNEIIFYQNFASVFIFLPFFFVNFPDAEWAHLGIGVIYSLLIGIVVFSLFFYGLKYLQATAASSLMYLEVVIAIILGYLVLDESIRLNMIFGGILILGSSFLLTQSNAKEST